MGGVGGDGSGAHDVHGACGLPVCGHRLTPCSQKLPPPLTLPHSSCIVHTRPHHAPQAAQGMAHTIHVALAFGDMNVQLGGWPAFVKAQTLPRTRRGSPLSRASALRRLLGCKGSEAPAPPAFKGNALCEWRTCMLHQCLAEQEQAPDSDCLALHTCPSSPALLPCAHRQQASGNRHSAAQPCRPSPSSAPPPQICAVRAHHQPPPLRPLARAGKRYSTQRGPASSRFARQLQQAVACLVQTAQGKLSMHLLPAAEGPSGGGAGPGVGCGGGTHGGRVGGCVFVCLCICGIDRVCVYLCI